MQNRNEAKIKKFKWFCKSLILECKQLDVFVMRMHCEIQRANFQITFCDKLAYNIESWGLRCGVGDEYLLSALVDKRPQLTESWSKAYESIHAGTGGTGQGGHITHSFLSVPQSPHSYIWFCHPVIKIMRANICFASGCNKTWKDKQNGCQFLFFGNNLSVGVQPPSFKWEG